MRCIGEDQLLRKGNNLQCVQSYSKFTATDQIVLCQAMEATIAEVTKCSTSNDNFSQKLQATKRFGFDSTVQGLV